MRDSTDGFVISGASSGDQFGWDLINAGDQNGDGIDDLAIVSLVDDTVTVIFGRDSGTPFPAEIDLSSGPGSDGYTISNLGGSLDIATVSGGTDVGGSAAAATALAAPAYAQGKRTITMVTSWPRGFAVQSAAISASAGGTSLEKVW